MADWTEQDVNSLLPGEPWTSAKAIAAFENPVAITEAAPNAPRIVSQALTLARRNEQVVTGNGWFTVVSLGAFKWVHMQCALTAGIAAGDREIEVSVSSNGGASWATSQMIGFFTREGFYKPFSVNFGVADGKVYSLGLEYDSDHQAYADFGAGVYNAIRIRQATVSESTTILRVVPYLWESRT